MKKAYIGIDIGGTKTAVIRADEEGKILERIAFPTRSCEETLEKIDELIYSMLPVVSIGISCGGPLDEERGIILSPPNLPGWDEIRIVERIEQKFGIPTVICNDANACAVAEWRFGAGRDTRNMIFITFGTGLGAGLILNGGLYRGTNGNAGEIGHIRMDKDGPIGYGKKGSWEGFCSGGGLKQIGQKIARKAISEGRAPKFCPSIEDLQEISARSIAIAADEGDVDALEVYTLCAQKLGAGLSLLIDILNPEVIVIGSIYARSENLFRKEMEKVIQREALPSSAGVCKILPAELGDQIGDYAAVSVAIAAEKKGK